MRSFAPRAVEVAADADVGAAGGVGEGGVQVCRYLGRKAAAAGWGRGVHGMVPIFWRIVDDVQAGDVGGGDRKWLALTSRTA